MQRKMGCIPHLRDRRAKMTNNENPGGKWSFNYLNIDIWEAGDLSHTIISISVQTLDSSF